MTSLVLLVALYFGQHPAHPVGTAHLRGCVVSVTAISGAGYVADVSCKGQKGSYFVYEVIDWDKAKQKSLHRLEIAERP